MAYYGFRLFEIELRALTGRKSVAFEDCDGEHFSVIAHRILQSNKGTTVVEDVKGAPDEDAGDSGVEEDAFAGRRGLRVLEVERVGHAVWVDALAGRYGDQEIAQGAPGQTDDSPLKGRAPSYTFRFGFYFPGKGNRGVLAVEDISRSCPVDLMRQLLLNGSKAESVVKAEASAAARKEGDTEKTPLWWKLAITPLVDEEQITRLINDGRSQRVELKKHAIGGSRSRDQLEYELSAPGLTDSQRTSVAGLVTDWGSSIMKRRRAPAAERAKMPLPSETEGARELAAVLGQTVAALDFDEGAVIVEDSNGATKRITPTRLNEVFTYPLSRNGPPSDVAFHERTRETARRLARSLALTGMEWPKKP